jgi:DNA-binding response OmpR family regulator
MSDVLVVEDDLVIADLLQDALEAEGHRVSGVARTVAEAKESLCFGTQYTIFFSVDVLKDIGQVGLGRTPTAPSF